MRDKIVNQKCKIEYKSFNITKQKKTEKMIITVMAQNWEYIIIQWKKNKLQKDDEFSSKKLFEVLENEIRMKRFQKLWRSILMMLSDVSINKGKVSEALLHYRINISVDYIKVIIWSWLLSVFWYFWFWIELFLSRYSQLLFLWSR